MLSMKAGRTSYPLGRFRGRPTICEFSVKFWIFAVERMLVEELVVSPGTYTDRQFRRRRRSGFLTELQSLSL